jgi:hypothetical protein
MDDYSSASTLALNVVTELCGIKASDDEYIVLQEALDVMKDVERPCMLELCNVLDQFPAADELKPKATRLARRIHSMRKAGMSMLLFGNGTEKAITLDNRLNILQIQNLMLPSPDTPKDQYTNDETLSIVLMMVLGSFAKKFALVKRNVFSTILFDESWALGKTIEGQKLFDFLARMGRSLFTGCIFNGHSVLDLSSEGVRNTITYKFCFHTDSQEEADRMLEYMNMEITPDNREMIMTLGNGECVFQDLYGRVGVLQFDAVFEDIIAAFSTTPKTREDEVAASTPEAIHDAQDGAADPSGEPVQIDHEKEAIPIVVSNIRVLPTAELLAKLLEPEVV